MEIILAKNMRRRSMQRELLKGEMMINEFHFTSYAQEILFGPGSLAQLGRIVEGMGWRRVLVSASGSARRGGTLDILGDILGERLVAVYESVRAHVPGKQVDEALKLARERQVDVVLGLGGGSPLGLAKAVSFALEEQPGTALTRMSASSSQARVPVIAIPTTYAGSEMTPTYGVTREVDGQPRKLTVSDPRIAPRLVLYDPLLTLDLPAPVTAATGINALAHCIEALYSPTCNPVSSASAAAGVRAIFSALPRCYTAGDDLEARTLMLEGAYLAGSALAHVAMALHHGICHVLGGTAGVPHGIANSIILPHAMRFNLSATASQLAPAAEAMGISLADLDAESAVAAAIERVDELIDRLNLPRRLRDAGVKEVDLARLAQLAFQSQTVRNNPKLIASADQLEALLRAAW
ncbi:MAG TPA: iron-containing alcohol dehydrogenase [Ktedonobacteraceae bacterium]